MQVTRNGCYPSKLFGFLLVLLTATIASAVEDEISPRRPKDFRLPTSVLPLHYDLEIQLYMSGSNATNFKFKGHVKIRIRCVNATNNITLHVNALNVETIIFSGGPSTMSIPVIIGKEEDKHRQFLIVKLDKDMEAGQEYTVEVIYNSILQSQDLSGLYLSSYVVDSNGTQEYQAVTQFQPTDARKAFPCFDEPSFKATFDITLIRPENLRSISNMPQKESTTTIHEDDVTYVKDVYMRTPKMSTYLVAFVVSDFQYTQKTTKNGILCRAWTKPEYVNYTRYALDVAVETLTYFEEFFNISYPLPKQDMISVEHKGAMENWGLVTYREDLMLYNEDRGTEAEKELIAIVVSHEVAHQWFGNLVSPAWWDDIWLNEGFATFVMYLGVDNIHPEWNIFDKFVFDELHVALSKDDVVSSNPVCSPISYPHEINELFTSNAITYSKAASLVRMLRHFLGYDTFKKGMTRYLKRLEYASASHDDLWNALEQQAREDGKNTNVKAIMDTWILQNNFPLVTVTRSLTSVDTVTISQERYLQDRNSNSSNLTQTVSPFNYTWTIPITFTTSRNPNCNQTDKDVQWLTRFERSKNITLGTYPLITANDWIIANVGQNGYYRVNYQLSNWMALAKQLKANHKVIPVVNRAQLINDAFNLANANYLGLDTAFQILDYLDREHDYIPWAAAQSNLAYVSSMLAKRRVEKPFKKFMQKKHNEPFKHIVLNNAGASHYDELFRDLLFHGACHFDAPFCRQKARKEFQMWMNSSTNDHINQNYKQAIYCCAIAAGGNKEWDFGFKIFKNKEWSSEREAMLYALTCSRDTNKLWKIMSFTLSNDPSLDNIDAHSAIFHVSTQNIGLVYAYTIFRQNFLELKKRYEANSDVWTELIDAVTKNMNKPDQLSQVKAFYKSHEGQFGSGEQTIKEAIGKITKNINWIKKNVPVLESWFTKAGYR